MSPETENIFPHFNIRSYSVLVTKDLRGLVARASNQPCGETEAHKQQSKKKKIIILRVVWFGANTDGTSGTQSKQNPALSKSPG